MQPRDGGAYRCRVDFYRAPTTIESMVLDVIGERDCHYYIRRLIAQICKKGGPYRK